jgi:hypothetical protein
MTYDVKNPRAGYCKKRVWGGWQASQCSRKASTPEGYCKQHHPDAEAKRDAERNARHDQWKAKFDRDCERERLEKHAVVLLELIANGHNDARALANGWVEKYEKVKEPTP